MSTCNQRSRSQSGFTLIELVIFIAVISVAVVGLLGVISRTTSSSADPQLRKQALVLAEAMLEEVQLARYTYCDALDPAAETATNALPVNASSNPGGCNTPQNVGATASTVRPYYNVTDYVDAFGTTRRYTDDAAGVLFPAQYDVRVAITPEAALGPAGAQVAPADATPNNMNALRITVVVTYPGGQPITLVGYRTRYAPNLI